MKKIVVASSVLLLIVNATELRASPQEEEYFIHSPASHTVSALEVNPGRPVVLKQKESAAYSGLTINMSKDSVFEGWLLPLGWGYGFYRNLEIGFSTNLLLDMPAASFVKWENAYLISDFQLYARYVILEGLLAANLNLIIPTVYNPTFGFDILVPAKYEIAGFEFFGHVRFDYRSPFSSDDVILFGLAVSGLYLVYDGLFVILDTGFSYRNTDANELIVPLGFGVGYKIVKDTLVKLAFTFPNIAADNNAFDSRFIQLVVVQTFDLSAPGK